MKLKTSPYGYYDSIYLDPREVTLFIDREYYPFYAVEDRRDSVVFKDQYSTVVKITKDIYGYHKFRFNYSVDVFSNYNTSFRYMLQRKKFFKQSFKYKGEDMYVYCVRGTLYSSEGEMLFSLATNSLDFVVEDTAFSVKDTTDSKFDYSTFKMFMSTKLLQENKYSFFYKKFFAEFITLFLNEGVELRVTSKSLEDIFYKNHSVEQDFRSIKEIHEFLKKDILEYLFFDENNYSPKSLFEVHSVNILNSEPDFELRKAVSSGPINNNSWTGVIELLQTANSTDRLNAHRSRGFQLSPAIPLGVASPPAYPNLGVENTEENLIGENHLPEEFNEENFIN